MMKTEQRTFRLELDGQTSIKFTWIPALNLWAQTTCVTNAAFANYSGKPVPPDRGAALGVSWNDASRFCKWLNAKFESFTAQRVLLRLPTASEWHSLMACRFVVAPPWGDICPDFGHERDFSSAQGVPSGLGEPNAWGIHYNASLWEWTGDIYDPTANYRILRVACRYGSANGQDQLLYHRTAHPDRGQSNVAFRIVAVNAPDHAE